MISKMRIYLLFLFIAPAFAREAAFDDAITDILPPSTDHELPELDLPGDNFPKILNFGELDPPEESTPELLFASISMSEGPLVPSFLVEHEMEVPQLEASADGPWFEEQRFKEESSGDVKHEYFASMAPDSPPEKKTAIPPEELPACPAVTSATPVKERIRAWLCEYTTYTVQTIEWIKNFEVWWAGCEEAEDSVSAWDDSIACPNTTMVKCKCPNKLKCTDDGMGCKRCVCTDGNYKDATALFKLWRKEMAMFKKRFQIYKSKVESCTRADVFSTDECEADESEFSGEGRESSE